MKKNNVRELKHHGIKGQKWGVQNGPPYPLGEDDYSKKEKRAKKGSSLTIDKKKLAKTAAITVGAALAVIGGYALYESGALDGLIKSGKEFAHKEGGILGSESVTGIASRLKTTVADASKAGITTEEVRSLPYNTSTINDVDGDNNCPSTSLAYICNRLFGGDFKAVPDTDMTLEKESIEYIKSFFKDGTIKEIDPESRLGAGDRGCLFNQKLIDLIPNGSTGMLALDFKEGHWVNYEKTKDGVFTMVCNQKDHIETVESLKKLIEEHPSPYKYCYRILDMTNAEFSEDGLSRLGEILR